jgi:restriction system protein
MGLECEVTKASGDGGIDLIAHERSSIVGGRILVQVKRYDHMVNPDYVRALRGVMADERASRGILVTTSNFGPSSHEFAEANSIRLIDGIELVGLLETYGIG